MKKLTAFSAFAVALCAVADIRLADYPQVAGVSNQVMQVQNDVDILSSMILGNELASPYLAGLRVTFNVGPNAYVPEGDNYYKSIAGAYLTVQAPNELYKIEITDITPAISNAVPTWALAATKPAYTASEVGALSSAGGTLLGDLTVESTGEKSEISVEHGNEYIALRVKDNKATIETSDYTYAMPHGDGTIALTKNIPNVPEWALATQKPTYTASEVGATSPEAVSNIVSTAYVHKTLGVWMEYDEATGFYYYCHEEE